MPRLPACPDADSLQAYLLGRMPFREAEKIAWHLGNCSQCEQALQSVDVRDDLIERLGASHNVDFSLEEAECDRAIDRLKNSLSSMRLSHSPDDETCNHTLDTGSLRDQASSAANGEPASNLPRRMGRYLLQNVLGRGGMGTVYRAYDAELDRDVALKIPDADGVITPESRQRFLREARAAATISHPRICPIYDVGEINTVPYFTMLLVGGESLASRLEHEGRFPAKEAVQLVVHLADALGEAHRHGIVHRDVKPANVILSGQGEPLLTDFGMARRLGSNDPRLTQSESIIGTPAYMSPEQARGDQGLIGPESDVYSLGVVLYELLTGKRPFVGSLADILGAILHQEPVRPTVAVPDLDPRLEAICLKAMEKRIADRYPTMEAFRAELLRYLTATVSDTPPRPLWKIFTATLAGLILLAGVVLVLRTDRGTVELRLHDHPVALRIFRGAQPIVDIDANAAYRPQHLPPGEYRIEITSAEPSIDVVPRQFRLERDKTVVIEAQPRPVTAKEVPSTEVAETQRPFAIPVNGLLSEQSLEPLQGIRAWESVHAFAELNGAGTMEYPVLPRMRYAFETDLQFGVPDNTLHFVLGDDMFRVSIRVEWDPIRKAYRCRLQRSHGRGNWFLNWRTYRVGKLLKFRLLMYDGMAVLFEGDEQILSIPSVAVPPRLRINAGGENPREMTIQRCEFRPLTPVEGEFMHAAREAAYVEEARAKSAETAPPE